MKLWRVDDVMTKDVVAVREDTPYRELVDLLIRRRVSAVPVLDSVNHVVGVVSEADLLFKVSGVREPKVLITWRYRSARRKARARTARDVMTAPPVTALASLSVVAAARRMQDAGVKRLPVTDDLGRLIGIVTRGDLLRMHQRSDAQIRRDVTEEVLPHAIPGSGDELAVTVAGGVVNLAGHVHLRSYADRVARQTARVPGVVDVVDEVRFDIDDRLMVGSEFGTPFGVA